MFSQHNNVMAQISSCICDAETGLPIEFAYVKCGDAFTLSNSEGNFELDCGEIRQDINISHVTYGDSVISSLSDTIFLHPKQYSIEEAVIVPENIVVDQLKKIWSKYTKYKIPKNYRRNWYYRQTTWMDNQCVEYLEALFDGNDGYRIPQLIISEGRYAQHKEYKGLPPFSAVNFYNMCVKSPVEKSKCKLIDYPISLYKDFAAVYRCSISKILHWSNDNEIFVYELIPIKSKNVEYVRLYVCSTDNNILRYEVRVHNGMYFNYHDLPFKEPITNIEISYSKDSENMPSISSIKFESTFMIGDTDINYGISKCRVSSMLTKSSLKSVSKEKKLNKYNDLKTIILNEQYNPEFWDNNPMVKRTVEEDSVLNYFKSNDLFIKTK